MNTQAAVFDELIKSEKMMQRIVCLQVETIHQRTHSHVKGLMAAFRDSVLEDRVPGAKPDVDALLSRVMKKD
jgi:hypothetical protein